MNEKYQFFSGNGTFLSANAWDVWGKCSHRPVQAFKEWEQAVET